jgi:hypothetical protein
MKNRQLQLFSWKAWACWQITVLTAMLSWLVDLQEQLCGRRGEGLRITCPRKNTRFKNFSEQTKRIIWQKTFPICCMLVEIVIYYRKQSSKWGLSICVKIKTTLFISSAQIEKYEEICRCPDTFLINFLSSDVLYTIIISKNNYNACEISMIIQSVAYSEKFA